ncbi:hypothetical protein BX616_007838, partial [Lobosporangium transversale]
MRPQTHIINIEFVIRKYAQFERGNGGTPEEERAKEEVGEEEEEKEGEEEDGSGDAMGSIEATNENIVQAEDFEFENNWYDEDHYDENHNEEQAEDCEGSEHDEGIRVCDMEGWLLLV